MGRKVNKNRFITYENSIKKSNELSMAKLNQGLTLNQMQLLAYAIYSTQTDGKTNFRKHNFQDKFEIKQYRTEDAYKDGDVISQLRFSTIDLENDEFNFTNVFSSIKYKKGDFSFKWNPDFIPHILELKDKFVLTDLTITSKFKSSFSWTLYDFLKAHYGYWHKELTKEALMKLFGVEERITYQKSTAQLKRGVLDIAIEEINKYTELEVWYTEKRIGNKITAFTLHWSRGKQVTGATDKQISLLQEIYDEVQSNMFDYLEIKSFETARRYIIQINDIHSQIKEELSSKKANELIKMSLDCYKQLENLVVINGERRDTSVYYNWLNEKE